MEILTKIFLGLMPSVLLVWYFFSRSEVKSDSVVIVQALCWGSLIALPVQIAGTVISAAIIHQGNVFIDKLIKSFVGASLVEETFKLIAVYLLIRFGAKPRNLMESVAHGAYVGLGFATIENLTYILDSGAGVGVIRAFTAVPCHAFLGAIMGYYLGVAWVAQGFLSTIFLLRAWIVPVILHGLYDLPLMMARLMNQGFGHENAGVVLFSMAMAVVLIEGFWVVYLIGRIRTENWKMA